MLRASDISVLSDFELEHLREDLRDRRSCRYRRNLQAIAIAITQMAGTLASIAGLAHLLGWL
jgi:hypothetical protein